MIRKIIFSFLVFLNYNTIANATMIVKDSYGIKYIENAPVEELEKLYQEHKYTNFKKVATKEYPAIFLKSFPKDFREIKSLNYRNELFIKILTPLALKINQEIQNERDTILNIEKTYQKNNALKDYDIKKLDELSNKYNYFTRAKNTGRINEQLHALKLRVNQVPPSILIATAAMETNWGFSRIANEANSLYKEKIWFTNEGLEPLENKNDGYRFKIFDSLIDSMRSFALTFNSDINYQSVWFARENLKEMHGLIAGENIAYALATSSTLPNFAGILDYTTAFYNLFILDMGHLKIGD